MLSNFPLAREYPSYIENVFTSFTIFIFSVWRNDRESQRVERDLFHDPSALLPLRACPSTLTCLKPRYLESCPTKAYCRTRRTPCPLRSPALKQARLRHRNLARDLVRVYLNSFNLVLRYCFLLIVIRARLHCIALHYIIGFYSTCIYW